MIVVGGGPGGYVAAVRAAQLGMKPAIVELVHLGGVCLNWGCIPTKALLCSADVFRKMKNADAYGLAARDVGFDMPRIVARSRAVAGRLRAGVEHLLRKNRVPVFDGRGKLSGRGKVSVTRGGEPVAELAAARIILATGARPRLRALRGLEPDGDRVWTCREAMVADRVPECQLVVGAGAIGIEFASFFHTMGADVVVVEAQGRVLPAEDEEISALARESFEKQGMTIRTGATVRSVRRSRDALSVTIDAVEGPQESVVDRVSTTFGAIPLRQNHDRHG